MSDTISHEDLKWLEAFVVGLVYGPSREDIERAKRILRILASESRDVLEIEHE